jgi:uncharacterized repeat protein (TIGR03803 family)
VQVSGSFYGTTSMGGTNDMGTAFQITPSGSLTTLLSFNGTNGAYPYAGLVAATDGYLYGLTAGGGANHGTAFRIDLSGTHTRLRSFAGSDGSFPYAELIQARDGAFYGTTMYGGSGSGVVFKMTSAGAVTVLRSLSTSDGTLPEGALVQASNGKMYGTTPSSGPSGAAGTVFEVTSSGAFTRILAFNGAPATPYGRLLARPDGSLYGVSAGGGAMSAGTIFKLVPGVSFELLHGFQATQDGTGAYDGLSVGSDGALYGTAPKGGADTVGTIYKLTSSDTFKLLMSPSTADASGFYPYGSVVQASDGALYGVMMAGGAGSAGTIYKMTTAGAVTLAHAFDSAKHGSKPYGRLVAASDGLLYGTTTGGGSSYAGTLFSYDPAAKRFALLYTFGGTNGSNPFAGLTEGSDGRLYGTAFAGGANGFGTVFAFDKATGALTRLYSFKGTDGAYPYAGLVEAADGRLYGTTSGGGANNQGTIFSIQKSGGGFTVMHSFNGTDGSAPRGGLTQGADFALYGVTPKGGATNGGVIFRIDPLGGGGGGLAAPSNLTATAASTTRVNLAWTIHSTDETEFQVERCTGSACSNFTQIGTTGAQTATYADTTVSQQTTYRYRVRAANPSGTSGYSNIASVTTASAATITVTSPNTGVNWGIGSTQRIKWKHSGGEGSTVRIQISRDSGGTWTDIASSVANTGATTGSYKWVVEGQASSRARIRVAFTDGSGADVSDRDFTISAPFVQVTSPDVSATLWTGGTNASIKWISNLGSLEKVKIELSKDGGATYTVTVLSSTPSDGSQSVPVQTSWLTTNAKVRITWLKDATVKDQSDEPFLIR